MELRTLGKTDLQVSTLGVGTWQLSGPITLNGKADGFPDIGKQQAIDLIRACADMGINVIDTASIYGDGEGERRVGEAIRSDRDRWVICTKFGIRRMKDSTRELDTRPEIIRPRLEDSLKRLGTDRVEVLHYHAAPDPAHLNAHMEEMAALKQEGKIRYVGVSTLSAKVLRPLAKHGLVDVVLCLGSLISDSTEIRAICRKHNLGLMVRGTLAGGRLSGRYFDRPPAFDAENTRAIQFSKEDTTRYAAFRDLLPEGTDMASFAYRYMLDCPDYHTVVLGGKTIQDYQMALQTIAMPPLDAATRKRAAQLGAKLSSTSASKRGLMAKARRLIRRLVG